MRVCVCACVCVCVCVLGSEGVSLLERCPHFRGWYVQASMELGPEDVSLLERCPHFRGWYVQASMELRPEDVPIREVSSFQRVGWLHPYIRQCSMFFTT